MSDHQPDPPWINLDKRLYDKEFRITVDEAFGFGPSIGVRASWATSPSDGHRYAVVDLLTPWGTNTAEAKVRQGALDSLSTSIWSAMRSAGAIVEAQLHSDCTRYDAKDNMNIRRTYVLLPVEMPDTQFAGLVREGISEAEKMHRPLRKLLTQQLGPRAREIVLPPSRSCGSAHPLPSLCSDYSERLPPMPGM